MGEACLEARSASKRYHDGVVAVENVDLVIPCGRVVAVLGPNGSGKSTLLAMAAGALRPSGGVFRVLGINVWGSRGLEARRLIGYLPQGEPLHPLLTGWENLRLHASMRNVDLDRVLVAERAEALGRRVGSYSGGMRRKLAVIAVLIHGPRVVILDEPDSGLDPVSRRRLATLLQGLTSRGSAVLFSTHIGEAAEHADHVVFMYRGRVVAAGAPRELVQRYAPGHRVELKVEDREGFLVEARGLSGVDLLAAEGEEVVLLARGGPDLVAEVARVAARHGLHMLTARQPGLEDAFIAATGSALTA